MATTTSNCTTTTTRDRSGVGLDALACPGCAEPVDTAAPAGRGNGPASGFCHRDGSELCPDSGGTAGEPVEYEHLQWSTA